MRCTIPKGLGGEENSPSRAVYSIGWLEQKSKTPDGSLRFYVSLSLSLRIPEIYY